MFIGMLLLMALGAAAKGAWDHAWEQRGKSRQGAVTKAAQGSPSGKLSPGARRKAAWSHDAAWWVSEAAHGFPVHRTGWHSGWLKHRTEWDQHRARREEARTVHLDTRASILKALPEHRKRQAEARALIDEATAPPTDSAPTRRADGKPETEADKRFFDLRESGYTGPIDQDGNIPDPADPALAALCLLNGQLAASPATPTEGAPAMPETAEMNYTAALEAATQIQDEAEGSTEDAKKIQAAADAAVSDTRRQRISNALDALTGILQDGPTLSEAAEVDDALRADQAAAEALAEAAGAREQAAQNLSDAAEAFRSGLVNRHGGIKDAVDDAPVEPAEMAFYRGD